jgi:hypothetical protein
MRRLKEGKVQFWRFILHLRLVRKRRRAHILRRRRGALHEGLSQNP